MTDAKTDAVPLEKPEAEDPQRRILAMALFGALGGAALLEACASEAQGPEAVDQLSQAASASATVWWVDTVLGPSFPTTRDGDLATHASSSLGGATVVVARGCRSAGDGGGGLFYWDSTSTMADDGGTVIQPSGVNPGRWKRIYSGPLSVKWFGAIGDGTTDDTIAAQNALNAAASAGRPPRVVFNGGNYSVLALTVPAALLEISGSGTLTQRSLGNNVLVVSGAAGLSIRNLTFAGIAGNNTASVNTGIDITSSTNVKVLDCTFSGFQYHAVHVKGSSDIEIAGNRVTSVSQGLRITFCRRVRIHHNYVAFPQYTGFNIAIGLGSTNDTPSGVSTDVVITDNIVESYPNSQAIMGHACQRGVVANNNLYDVLTGISFNPYQVGDTVGEIVIANNVCVGTSTTGAAQGTGNYGIFAGGGPGDTADHVTIVGNRVSNFNKIAQDGGQGGISVGYCDAAIIGDNVVHDNYGVGIGIINPVTNCRITNNTLANILDVAGPSGAGIYVWSSAGGSTGRIDRTRIDTVRWGARFDASCPGLKWGEQELVNISTSQYMFAPNVTFDRPVNRSGSVAISGSNTTGPVTFANPEPDPLYQLSSVVAGTTGSPSPVPQVRNVDGKTTSGFTVYLTSAPGAGKSVTVDWILAR